MVKKGNLISIGIEVGGAWDQNPIKGTGIIRRLGFRELCTPLSLQNITWAFGLI